jgi:hypothetical protein
MSLLFMDSFDHYSTADIALKYTTAGGTIQTTSGRRSSGCLRTTGGSDQCLKSLTPADNVCTIGFAYKTNSIGDIEIVLVRQGGTTQTCLRLTSAGALIVTRDIFTANTLATSAAGVITVNTFYYIEWKSTIHTSAGITEVKVNGTTVISASGLNNAAAGTNNWNAFRFDGNGSTTEDIDDLYVLDGAGSAPLNTFLGDIRVDARMPTAEGTTIGWTPLSGTDNALMVDEIPANSDTDYNSTATVGAVDTLVVQDAPVVGATILGVQTNIFVKKTDAGTTTIAPVIRSGTDQIGTTVAPGTTYAYTREVFPTNPATGVAWTEAGFNAAEFGYKRIS